MPTEKPVTGLGLESSCDETAAAIVRDGSVIMSNIISSQIDIHRAYNGVVPEIASRAHLESINAIVADALDQAGVSFSDLDYVAATNRPGLTGSLLVALQSAKAISYACQIPLITVNHLEAHLYAPFLENDKISFPAIGLLVSGGNTALYLMRDHTRLELLGKTGDDAVGEAYDKIAKHLGLGYPGGPLIDAMAAKVSENSLRFPKLLAGDHSYRFSYSGLKTAVITHLRHHPDTDPALLVHAFQESALEILARRAFAAAREYGVQDILVAGGVSANRRLRRLFADEAGNNFNVHFASPILCTDNGAMIAGLGYQHFIAQEFADLAADVYARA